MVAMVEFPQGTLLVAAIRFAQLAATSALPTRLTAVALSAIAVTADMENPAAPRGTARSLPEDEFQGANRPFPKAGLDKGPLVVAR
jgi:hypothetical protein